MTLVKTHREEGGILTLTLNRPEKRNALNVELLSDLISAVESAGRDARVLVIQGEGPVFCAGLDLKEARDVSKAEQSAKAVAQLLKSVYASPCVTIAAVHGAAFAGGAGLMAACDFVVAEEGAAFGFPETRRGLVAALVMPLLARQLSFRHLRELLLFGETVDTRKALEIGLINRVVPEGARLSEALRYAREAVKGAPEATRLTKQLMDKVAPASLEEQLKTAFDTHHKVRLSGEAEEGINAFLEKRNPKWTNSSMFDKG